MFFIYILFAILFGCLWILQNSKSRSKPRTNYVLPKGPRGIPFLGNVHQLLKNPHLQFQKWAQTYGKLYTVYFGSQPVLLVNDAPLMKEIFSSYASTGKFRNDCTLLQSLGPYGILNTVGKEWFEERQLCLKGLKNFVFGRGSLEPLIIEEAQELCDWIRNEMTSHGTVVLNSVLKNSTNNALWTIITGERVSFQDSKVAHLMEKWVTTFQFTMRSGLGFLPWLKHIAPNLTGYNVYYQACQDIHRYVQAKFEEHQKSFVKDEHRDLLDLYIERANNAEDDSERELIWKNNVATVANLFIAGGETAASTINFMLFYLVQNPDVQRKMHMEIDRVVGPNRDPNLTDKQRMPYVDAVIMETLHYSSLAPFGVPHQLLEDVKVADYHLPKGMILMANIYNCHFNENVWGDPEKFRPERFLGETIEAQELAKKYLVPFQLGKRQCAAESLAKEVLFIFVSKILQEFSVSRDPNVELRKYSEPDVGVLLLPQQFGVVLKQRK